MSHEVRAAGIAVTGLVEKGVLKEALNLPGWIDVPLQGPYTTALRAPCVVMMDTVALAECEKQLGGHEQRSRMFVIAIGTGVGGASILDGQVLGCQVGLVHHYDDGQPRGRNPVRLDDLISGRAIARRATEAAQRKRKGQLVTISGRCGVTAEQVAVAARTGDATAIEILADVGSHIGWAAADVTHLLTLDRVILAGGVGNSGEALVKPARESWERRLHPHFRNRCDFVVSRIGKHAGAIGAALLADAATRSQPG
jgi:glucokinase